MHIAQRPAAEKSPAEAGPQTGPSNAAAQAQLDFEVARAPGTSRANQAAQRQLPTPMQPETGNRLQHAWRCLRLGWWSRN